MLIWLNHRAGSGALDADYLNGGAADFEDILGGSTAFDLLAEALDTVLVDGAETLASLVSDGDSSLQEGALSAFGGLFGDN